MMIMQKMTPNKMSRKGYKPDMIVEHITEGSYLGAVSWLQNPKSQVSSHFVVSRKGEITQLVPLTDAAWCNGTSMSSSSLKFYGFSTNQLVRERKTNANYFTVSIEYEGMSAQTQGALTQAQFNACLWLHQHIRTEVKRLYALDIPIDRDHIVGHYEITPKTKPNCPGKKFPWDKLIRELQGPDETVKISMGGKVREVEGEFRNDTNYVAVMHDNKKLKVPIRDVAEALGLEVAWDKSKKVVVLS